MADALGGLEGIELVLFDFGGTLADLRNPLRGLRGLSPTKGAGDGTKPRPPGALRKWVRQLGYPLVARLYECYPDTEAVLMTLKESGYRMAILSNNSSLMLDQARALDLGRFFPHIFYSEEIGIEKPDPEIFRVALARLGATSHGAVYIGDDYRADVLGAQAAGVVAVLVDRSGTSPPGDHRRVSNLTDLLQLLPPRK